jgi:hypothetical protein
MKIPKYPWHLWPYGAFYCGGKSVVLFDRHSQPLVRIPDRAPTIPIPAHDRDDRRIVADIPIRNGERCCADEKIEGITNTVWFYSENARGMRSPAIDAGARGALATLLIQIPELAHEIVERSRRK